jgi:CheY-like chemotaxis protein/two-component sensor histidine kinase
MQTRDSETLREEAAEMRRRLQAAAHEMRTPLTGAATIVDLLATSELATGRTGDYVLLLREAVRHLIAVTNDMLDLGRLEADAGLGPLEAFAPSALLASAAGLAAIRAQAKGLDLRLEMGTLPERLTGHPVLVRRLVENLLDNALKHTDAGHIRLAAMMQQDSLLSVTVSDSGIGIAAQHLERIFEPYAQLGAGRRAGGTGLGLALVKAAVERVGGSVTVDSRPGEGASFRLTIPVGPADAVTGGPAAEAVARRSLDILLAEDNPVNRFVAGAILGEFGHRVVFSADGRAALAALTVGRYDLVLMDIEMPDLDGHAALAAIRSLESPAAATPVVAVSARGEEARQEALDRGFDGYVAKPIDPAALFTAIEAATRRAREPNRPG